MSVLVVHAVVREHHRLIVVIPLHLKVGVHQGPKRPQEAPQISKKLLGLKPNHNDQGSHGQICGDVAGTVQAVPAAGLVVAALVADAISIVVFAVFVIPATEEG